MRNAIGTDGSRRLRRWLRPAGGIFMHGAVYCDKPATSFRWVIGLCCLAVWVLRMSPQYPPHPDNAPGDFYVECDSCISCEAPYQEAPDLMGRPGSSPRNGGCYFGRQPTTWQEIERACEAVAVSCVEAVRYKGRDRNILSKLYQLGAYSSCDVLPTDDEKLIIDYVRKNYPEAKTGGVHWTFVCDELPGRVYVACCFGRYRHTLGVFQLDKLTGSIVLHKDDKKYRPRFDLFRRPRRSIFNFWPFTRAQPAQQCAALDPLVVRAIWRFVAVQGAIDHIFCSATFRATAHGRSSMQRLPGELRRRSGRVRLAHLR